MPMYSHTQVITTTTTITITAVTTATVSRKELASRIFPRVSQ